MHLCCKNTIHMLQFLDVCFHDFSAKARRVPQKLKISAPYLSSLKFSAERDLRAPHLLPRELLGHYVWSPFKYCYSSNSVTNAIGVISTLSFSRTEEYCCSIDEFIRASLWIKVKSLIISLWLFFPYITWCKDICCIKLWFWKYPTNRCWL